MKTYFSLLLLIVFGLQQLGAQETRTSQMSIPIAIGFGLKEGMESEGIGGVCSIGWQKTLDKNNRWRLQPSFTFGEYTTSGISDTRDAFFRTTSIETKLHHDLLKYKAFSIVLTGGVFLTTERGLKGGGGELMNRSKSGYFSNFYYGGLGSAGIRISPKKSKIDYELKPINFRFGKDQYFAFAILVGIDVKLDNYKANKQLRFFDD
ncbi:MAG: hypothetical protein P8H45_04215 [Flavobacteriaceae bacterium]|nr:hypothetical protein [Flavobacteriaceae bacterium]